MLLKTIDLKKYYGLKGHVVKAIDGISLSISQGEFVAIVGTSGSGKSTLLHLLGGLDQPTSGQVMFNDEDLHHLTPDQLTIFRRRNIGFVFQSYNLIPTLSVYENLTLPLALDGTDINDDHIHQLLKTLGLSDRHDHLPSELSGGQQQRVAIGRALVTKPLLLLADEPTGNLDTLTSQEVMGLLKVSNRSFHQTIVVITHNQEIAQMADRIIHIEDGKVVNDGK